MFLKLGMALAGAASAGAIVFFAFASDGGAALAADPTTPPPSSASGPSTVPNPPEWFRARLHESIIRSAADVIGIRVDEVREGLGNGLSLAEIGRRHGVREDALERGILRDERQELDRLVDAGLITPQHARDVMQWLTNHIEEIVHHHFDFDELITPPA
ncbi:MAG TPA: hypothetical protein VH951_13290 [Dehalococcoidia bacterium]|jgi:hypothetical protein